MTHSKISIKILLYPLPKRTKMILKTFFLDPKINQQIKKMISQQCLVRILFSQKMIACLMKMISYPNLTLEKKNLKSIKDSIKFSKRLRRVKDLANPPKIN